MTIAIIIIILLLLIVLILNALFLYLQKRNSTALGTDAPHITRDPGLDEATENFLKQQKEEWTLQSNGNQLYGWFTPKENSHTTVIVVHGFAVDHSSLDIHAQMFNALGCNVLQIDNRAAGKSSGRFQGFGYLESIDLVNWITELVKKRPSDKIILFVASMGAATVMMTAGKQLPDNVIAVIEDSGYTSMLDVVNFHFKQRYHFSGRFLLKLISVVAKVRSGFFYGQADCTKALDNCHLPILFMHGKKDTAVPYFMRDQLMEHGDFPKVSYALDKGVHIRSYYTDSTRYQQTVEDFIEKYGS